LAHELVFGLTNAGENGDAEIHVVAEALSLFFLQQIARKREEAHRRPEGLHLR